MIDVDEERHEELAVEAVGEAAVTRDDGPKVFDVEGAFEAGSEEAAKRSHERPEDREDEGVELERVEINVSDGSSADRLPQRSHVVRQRKLGSLHDGLSITEGRIGHHLPTDDW